MGQLVFQATAGGQTALVGPNPATNFSLNVPAVNGTLVTTGDTGTVTNTMLASSAYTAPGTIGSGTPNTGAFTSLSATSVTDSGLTAGRVNYNGTGGLLVDSANMTFNGTSLTLANDASISGLTVGKGTGAQALNTAFGYQALNAGTNGTYNTAIGYQAGLALTSGTYNTALGNGALVSATSASHNTALGKTALNANTADGNTAVGSNALRYNTTGAGNQAFGYGAMITNTTGGSNTAVGQDSLSNNTTASNNTAVGYQAGYSNTTSGYNTFLGWYCGASYSFTGGNGYNVFVGSRCGQSVTTGTLNTFVGDYAGGTTTTGSSNSFFGQGAGYAITTGGKNTVIGAYSGNQGISGGPTIDIRTSSNNIILSDGDGNPRLWFNSAGTMQSYTNVNGDVCMYMVNYANSTPYGLQVSFTNAAPNNSSQFFFLGGDSSTNRFVAMSNGGLKNYQANNVNLSDEREKKNISLVGNYLDKLCQVPVKTFLYNDQTDTELNVGVIAQDLQSVCPELVTETNWANKDEPEKMRLSVYETDLKYAMLKAIQELNAKVTALEAQLGAK